MAGTVLPSTTGGNDGLKQSAAEYKGSLLSIMYTHERTATDLMHSEPARTPGERTCWRPWRRATGTTPGGCLQNGKGAVGHVLSTRTSCALLGHKRQLDYSNFNAGTHQGSLRYPKGIWHQVVGQPPM